MKKKITLLSVLVIVIVILSFSVYSYISINSLYPQTKQLSLNLGDETKYSGLAFKVVSNELFSYDEFVVKCNNKIDTKFYTDSLNTNDLVFSVALINLKNNTNSSKTISLENIVITSDAYSNGIDINAFSSLNKDISYINPTLEPQQEITVYLVYSMLKPQFIPREKKLSNVSLKLMLSLYPEKIFINLK